MVMSDMSHSFLLNTGINSNEKNFYKKKLDRMKAKDIAICIFSRFNEK